MNSMSPRFSIDQSSRRDSDPDGLYDLYMDSSNVARVPGPSGTSISFAQGTSIGYWPGPSEVLPENTFSTPPDHVPGNHAPQIPRQISTDPPLFSGNYYLGGNTLATPIDPEVIPEDYEFSASPGYRYAIDSFSGPQPPAFNTGSPNDRLSVINHSRDMFSLDNEAQHFNEIPMPLYEHAMNPTSPDFTFYNQPTSSVTYNSYSANSGYQNYLPPQSVLIPQRKYRVRTSEHRINEPNHLEFFMDDGSRGFPAKDALNEHYSHLRNRDDTWVLGQGNSVSIRIEMIGYPSWSRQIKTITYHKPPRSIDLAKLCTEVARSLKLFIKDNYTKPIERSAEQWRVGPTGDPSLINTDNVLLVGLERVSKASWQPIFHRMI